MTVATRRPTAIVVDRYALVGELMDLQALASEALTANAAAIQSVLRLPAGPMRHEAHTALSDCYGRVVRLLNSARRAAGNYDGVNP